ALMNYLVRLGWSHGDQEIFSVPEMINLFDLKGINKAPAAFNPEKLLWLNQYYLKTLDLSDIAKHFKWHLEKLNIDITQGPPLEKIIEAQRERCKTLLEMAEKSRFLYQDITAYDEDAAQKNLTPDVLPALLAIREALEKLPEWNKEEIHQVISNTAQT